MAQIRVTRSLRTIGLQARAASRVVASPRAGLSWAAPRASSPAPTLAFPPRLFSSAKVLADDSARPDKNAKLDDSAIPPADLEHDGTFASLKGHVDPAILSTIANELKLDKMTPVQSLATSLLPPQRPNALVQASTGAGKTLAFLLPALQQCINMKYKNGTVSAVVIVPTREAAMQVAAQARIIMKDVPQHRVQMLLGSHNKAKEQRRILEKADILIATPGRLLDHMRNDTTKKIFRHVHTIVVDDADRLLEMGARENLAEIIERIPTNQSTIQGMLFSARVNPDVEELAGMVCRGGQYKTISTSSADEPQIHERVQQDVINVPGFDSVTPALVGCMKEEAARDGPSAPFKATIFAPTHEQVDYYEQVLSRIPGLPPVSALHGRKRQGVRTRIMNEFRSAERAILVSTNIATRGMDLPGVTTVVQTGGAVSKEIYIDRLQLTASEAVGRGILIIADAEKACVDSRLGSIQFTPREANLQEADVISEVNNSMKFDVLEHMYRSWVSYYCHSLQSLGWSQEELIREANAFVTALGATKTPTMAEKNARKVGLNFNTPGLVMENTKSEA